MVEPRHPRASARLPLRTHPSPTGPIEEMGGLGAPLLPHLVSHRSHSRGWTQRQARPHHRDLGPPESSRAPCCCCFLFFPRPRPVISLGTPAYRLSSSPPYVDLCWMIISLYQCLIRYGGFCFFHSNNEPFNCWVW